MKRLLAIASVLISTIICFSSCDDDITTSGWLNHTVWNADLTLYGDFDEGEARIWFTGNGYRFVINAERESYGDRLGVNIASKCEYKGGEIHYDFPVIEIPYFVKDEDGNAIQYIWKGTFSEDRKELTIEEFDGAFFSKHFHNVVFKR